MSASTAARWQNSVQSGSRMPTARGMKAHESDPGLLERFTAVFRPIRVGSCLRRRAPEVARGKADRASPEFPGWHQGDESRRESVAGHGSGGIRAHRFGRRAASIPARCSNAGVPLQPKVEAPVAGARRKNRPRCKRLQEGRRESDSRDGRLNPIRHPAAPVARSKLSISRQGPIFRDSEPDGFSDEGRGRRVSPADPGVPGRCEWFRCARASPLTGSNSWIGTEPTAANTARFLSGIGHGDS